MEFFLKLSVAKVARGAPNAKVAQKLPSTREGAIFKLHVLES